MNNDLSIIYLQNGKIAVLYDTITVADKTIYKYNVPCPVCNTYVKCYSYDGKYFENIQVNCKNCGIFFKPVIKRKEVNK